MFRFLAKATLLATTLIVSNFLIAQDLCENGLAGGIYPCDNVDLYSFVSTADLGAPANIEYNDIWGWTSADGREYVILGRTDGTSFIEITDPLNPVNVGFLPTFSVNSIWRDMKVYGDYCFIVSEAGGHGMQVFDLTQLSGVANPPVTFTEDAHYAGFGNAHNIVINPNVARAYAVGTNTFSGGLHIVDISNPLNPVIAGDFANDGYTHDAQVVTYNGPDATYVGREICFASNENTLTIVDVNDPTDCQQVSSVSYTGFQYTHQGWVTEDHRYFLQNDELDEANLGTNTRTLIWDVSDLDNPVFLGDFLSTEAAIDHNNYIDGNLVFQANYRSGLRILDAQNVASGTLSEVAFFDVYPASNSAQFNGAWSNYPYFGSGIVAVSHIEEGLFLLKPSLINSNPQLDSYCYDEDPVIDIVVEEGFLGPVNLSVSNGLPAGAVATFSANGVEAGAYTLTLTNMPPVTGDVIIEITGVGSEFTFRTTSQFLYLDCANDVLGCTDPTATNYDPLATIDDGSCVFPCIDVTLSIDTDCWPNETSWILQDDQGNIIDQIAGGSLATQQSNFTWNFCLEAGCYDLIINDSFGDGLAGIASGCAVDGNYQLTDSQGNVIVAMGDPNFGSTITEPFCLTIDVPGCTDPNACNFDPAATSDDGSCQFPDGCTDPSACNYNAAALCDDGSCTFGDVYFEDVDGDGFGDPGAPFILCEILPGYATNNTDCDDSLNTVYPGAPGTGEGIDNNCNGNIDPAEQAPCLGDYTGDLLINTNDFLLLLAEFGCTSGCATDLNGDDLINSADVLAFLALFGSDCF